MTRFTCLALGLLFCAALCRAQSNVPIDPDDWVTLVPDLATAAGPNWLAPGFEMAHEYASATVPGDWTGYTGGFSNIAPSDQVNTGSAHGISVLDVVALDGNVAACVVHETMFTPTGMLTPSGDVPMIVAAGASNAWLGPDALKKLNELHADNITVQHAPYTIQGVQFQGMWIAMKSNASYTVSVYDENSGLLLHQQIVAPGPCDPQGNAQTLLTNVTYRHSRSLNIPWINGAAPQWLGTFNRIDYQGSQFTQSTQFANISLPLSSSLTPRRRGNGWSELAMHTVLGAMNGMPPQQNDSASVTGLGSFGGLFVPPAALAALQPGQQLDVDPVTGFKIFVVGQTTSPGGRAEIVIRQVGQASQVDWGYDPASGMMIAYGSTLTGVVPITTQVELTGSN